MYVPSFKICSFFFIEEQPFNTPIPLHVKSEYLFKPSTEISLKSSLLNVDVYSKNRYCILPSKFKIVYLGNNIKGYI